MGKKMRATSPIPQDKSITSHKPIAALAALFFLFNGMILYFLEPGGGGIGANSKGNGSTNNGESTQQQPTLSMPKVFTTRENKIYYRGEEVEFPQQFYRELMKVKEAGETPELLFDPTTHNDFYKKVTTFLETEKIEYKRIQRLE